MKMRLSSLALTLCMLMTLIPSALAAGADGNDTKNTATAISVNQDYTGNFEDHNDKDYYKFTLTKNETVSVTINTVAANPYLDLYLHSADKELGSWGFTSDSEVYPATTQWYNLPAGDYYLQLALNWLGTTTEPYTLRVNQLADTALRETEWNDTKNTADSVELDTSIKGSLSSNKDVDFFMFSLKANEIVSLTLNTKAAIPYMDVYLMDATQKELKSWGLHSDSEVYPYTTDRFNLPAGDYYVKTTTNWRGYSNEDYTLTVNSQFKGSGTPADREKEYNDTLNTGNVLPLNTTFYANLSTTKDKDFFRIEAPKAGTVTLTVDSRAANPHLSIAQLDGAGKKVNSWDLKSGDTAYPYTLDSVALAAGNHYLEITNHWSGFENKDYSIRVNMDGVTAPPTTPPVTPPVTPPTNPNAGGASSWAQTEVAQAIALGFVPAELQSNYQSNITRQEFCKLIVQMLMAKSSTLNSQEAFIRAYNVDLSKAPFSDSSDQYINIAYSLQIVNGTGSGMFSPSKSITRQEAASMLQRAAAVFQFTEYKGSAASFSDRGSLAAWASASVDFISANGIMAGSGGAFNPHGNYSREQSILTALRLFNAFPRESYAV